jgi:O-antigen ligase
VVLAEFLSVKPEDIAGRNRRMAAVNDVYTTAFFAGSAIIGSISALFLSVAAVWAIFRLSVGHIKLLSNTQIRVVALAFLAYPFSEFISLIVNQRGLDGLIQIGGAALFLSILPVASRLSLSSPENIADSTVRGAAGAGGLLVAYCLIELLVRGAERAEAGMGNANVLAAFSLFICCLCFSLVTIARPDLRKWAYFGAFCAFNALIFSGSRSAWGTAPFALFLAVLPMRRIHIKLQFNRITFLAGAVALLFLVSGTKIVLNRVAATISSFQQANVITTDVSIAQRFVLWRGGVEQFKASWLFGYGPDSTPAMITALGGNPPFSFTHYHNFLLNGAIRGGAVEVFALILVFASLIWFALQKSRNQTQRAGRALVGSTALAGFLPGMTGVLFTHDVVNAVFLYLIIIGLCLGIATDEDRLSDSQHK